MLESEVPEIKTEENVENEAPEENVETTEEFITAAEEAAPEPPPTPQTEQNNEATLNPLCEQENKSDTESKTKHRRYWAPKEEEKFYEIWGRENWRLTRHGKNTIFFAKWSDEMKERFNIDVKPEEVQCKVNQTRAKFRQVKKHMDGEKSTKWKKYEIVEKILKNQYRSKDDEPVPLEALENNRDVSPTQLNNCITQPPSPNSASNMSNIPEQNINLTQTGNADHQLTDEINMNSASLADQNLYCNSSQSTNNSFSTELFGSDQLEIKQEIENNIKVEGGLTESLTNEQTSDGAIPAITTITSADGTVNNISADHQPFDNQLQLHPNLPQTLPQEITHAIENTNLEHIQIHSSNPNSLLIQNRVLHNHSNSNHIALTDATVNLNNHVNFNSNSMQPPKPVVVTPSPRKRNRSSAISTAATAIPSEMLEASYLEEVRKKNVLLVEQGEINRKRLRLEERKVKLMEEFFPKFMNLQQEILQKLDNVSTDQKADN